MTSAGAGAYNGGLGALPPAGVQWAKPPLKPPVEDQGPMPPPPEADKVFVCKTVIFNGYAAVLHEMMHYFVFLHLFNVAHFPFNV